eukprot:4942286-Amphidinium_carterae.1
MERCSSPQKLILREHSSQARLSTAQSQRVLQWLAGSRDEQTVRAALTKLDTDVDLTTAMTGHASVPKSMWEEPVDEYEHVGNSSFVECASVGDLVLVEFYAEDND